RGSFSFVESTLWYFGNCGTWSNANGTHTLTMGSSGTSGTVRFTSDSGGRFVVAVEVNNCNCWCDIMTSPGTTYLVISRV
ncbi:fungal fruit body lectin, partial [Paxillus ammoniavirescens]